MSNSDYAATVISIIPFPLREEKPGIYPGRFDIPAAVNNEPQILVVGESIFHVEIDETRTITVKSPPNDVARSIVDDYLSSNLAYSVEEESIPGLMWVPGRHNKNDVKFKFKEELAVLEARQWKWFMKLVQMADDDWEKTRQHRAISDIQRYACKALGQDRPWIITPKFDSQTYQREQEKDFMKCVACQSMISRQAIICPSCKLIIDETKYKNLKFAEVK